MMIDGMIGYLMSDQIPSDKQTLLEELQILSESFEEAMRLIETDQEEFWNSLSKEDQLKAFCAVVRRIAKGELKDRRSYRGVLYNTFGFDTSSYVQAQEAGYLAIHNALFDWAEWQERGEGPDDWK